MARHNKKRNVGLIYELLVRRLSKAIVEQDRSKAKTVKDIINDRFKPGSELYKEFRLFNAVTSTTNVPDQIAYRILDEAKSAARDHDSKNLDIEKSRLIKDINHKLNESNFYDTKVNNYAVLASAQQLFNSWRSDSSDIAATARHEATVHAWLVSDPQVQNLQELKTQNVNDITVNVMQEKFEKKYGSSLNQEQSKLLRLFCEGNQQELVSYMGRINEMVKNQIAESKKSLTGDKFLLEKVVRVGAQISAASECGINEVSKSMTLAQLLSELRELKNV